MKKTLILLSVIFLGVIIGIPVIGTLASGNKDFKIDKTSLVKYLGKEHTVELPTNIDRIGRSAFEGNLYVEEVIIPKNVKLIEPYAFWGCKNLKKIIIAEGMEEISDFAFTNCTGLCEITIPDKVNTIGICSFENCISLKEIYLSPNVISIHETSFDGCKELKIDAKKGSYAYEYAKGLYVKQKDMPLLTNEYAPIRDNKDDTNNNNSLEAVDNSDKEQHSENDNDSQQSTENNSNVDIFIPEVDLGKEIGSTHIVGNEAVVFTNNQEMEVEGK